MDRQIIFESVGGAGGETCGIVNKQALAIELSMARQPTGNPQKVWFGLKEMRSVWSVCACAHACVCVPACMCTCVSVCVCEGVAV